MNKGKSALPFVLGFFIVILVSVLIGFCERRIKSMSFEEMRILKTYEDVGDRDRVVIKWPFSGKPIIE